MVTERADSDAIGFISFNRGATEADIAGELASGRLGPEQIVAVKQAENALTVELARIDQAREAAWLQDTQSAR
ncbi:hypothetical protein [Variovorax sp. Root434]|uniref:hypothetical protein n=1 Tax=unclassified Variovorax TaxID=663243 RepID=UPI0006FE4135|nr:hypothetical protein [Variovorax sp. Root434]KQX21309.1 hypothetical protein ASD05_17210 [Variovorax sp. Root434]